MLNKKTLLANIFGPAENILICVVILDLEKLLFILNYFRLYFNKRT